MGTNDFEKYVDDVLKEVKNVVIKADKLSFNTKVTISFYPTGAKINYDINGCDSISNSYGRTY